jgi:hypothetical protein
MVSSEKRSDLFGRSRTKDGAAAFVELTLNTFLFIFIVM